MMIAPIFRFVMLLSNWENTNPATFSSSPLLTDIYMIYTMYDTHREVHLSPLAISWNTTWVLLDQ